MKVSVIIPVYKVEPYIERCVRSVLVQTYRDIGVILVDDCSPDYSMTVAKKVIEESGVQDMTFVYLKHERNRGLSAARNTGIDAATGEYIYFLDSDDEITPDCIEQLIEPLNKQLYDFVIGGYSVVGSNKGFRQLTLEGPCTNVLESYGNMLWYPMAVNKLVNLKFLKDNGLYFKEGLIHEDELWSFQMACVSKALFAQNTVTYHYMVREGSIMTTEKKKEYKEWLFRIAVYMWKYVDDIGLSFNKTANNIIEAFIQSGHPLFVISRNMEGYAYYKTIRQKNCRDRKIYRHLSFTSFSGFVKYSHYLMPVPIGFYFKVLLRLPVIIKEYYSFNKLV